jgi:hypothetical protein
MKQLQNKTTLINKLFHIGKATKWRGEPCIYPH